MYCFFDVILSMPTPPTKGSFRGGAAVRPHPPELLWSLAPPWAHLRGNLATPWEKSWNRPPPICSPAPRVYFGTYCVCQNERTVAVHLMCTQYRMENDTTITKAPCFPATLEHAACPRTHERLAVHNVYSIWHGQCRSNHESSMFPRQWCVTDRAWGCVKCSLDHAAC